MKITGGKAISGAKVGILMLEAQFPRILGDMGNATTWPFPVLYRVVRGASPDRVVRNRADGLLDDFVAAARELIADGVDGITTNCGFLGLFQDSMAQQLQVPVATSSLMQVAMAEQLLPPGKRVGIFTISPANLSAEHLACSGCPADAPIGGPAQDGEFASCILNNQLQMDVEKARLENVDAAVEFVETHPEIGALVLECTNMVPYAADICAAIGLPVFSIYDFICWFQAGLQPRIFAPV